MSFALVRSFGRIGGGLSGGLGEVLSVRGNSFSVPVMEEASCDELLETGVREPLLLEDFDRELLSLGVRDRCRVAAFVNG